MSPEVSLINPIAVAGHNEIPEPTPFELVQKEITDLFEESEMWCDGAKVDNQELADGLSNLKAMMLEAANRAEAMRVAEKAPILAQEREIDDRYRPLKKKADQVEKAVNVALSPWLDKLEADRKAEEKRLRDEGAATLAKAQEALRTSDNIAVLREAETQLKDAKSLTRAANQVAKATVRVGSIGRATKQRVVTKVRITDKFDAMNHYFDAPEIEECLIKLAERDARQAPDVQIPGFTVEKVKEAV
jgi:hypothetical protein